MQAVHHLYRYEASEKSSEGDISLCWSCTMLKSGPCRDTAYHVATGARG